MKRKHNGLTTVIAVLLSPLLAAILLPFGLSIAALTFFNRQLRKMRDA